MAIPQNHTALTVNSHAAQQAGFTLVNSKEKDQQKKELAKLSALINVLKKDIEQVQTSGDSSETKGSSFDKVMAELALCLQMLQVDIAKSDHSRSSSETEVSKALVTMANDNLKEVQKKLAKMAAKEKAQKTEGTWIKVLEVVGAVVLDVIAMATMGPVGAALMIALSTALLVGSMTGGTQKLTDAIANSLEADGMSSEGAKILAAVIITVVVIVVSAGVGAAAVGEEAADEAADEALSNAKSIVKGLQKFAGKYGLAVSNGAQVSMQTGLIQELATAFATKNGQTNETEQKNLTIIFSVIAMAVAIVAGGASMKAMSNVGSAAAKDAEGLAQMSALRRLLTSSGGSKALLGLGVASNVGGGTASIFEGVTMVNEGKLLEAIAVLNANLALVGTDQKMLSSQMRSEQQHAGDLEKNLGVSNQAIEKLMEGMAAFANLFTQNSPV